MLLGPTPFPNPARSTRVPESDTGPPATGRPSRQPLPAPSPLRPPSQRRLTVDKAGHPARSPQTGQGNRAGERAATAGSGTNARLRNTCQSRPSGARGSRPSPTRRCPDTTRRGGQLCCSATDQAPFLPAAPHFQTTEARPVAAAPAARPALTLPLLNATAQAVTTAASPDTGSPEPRAARRSDRGAVRPPGCTRKSRHGRGACAFSSPAPGGRLPRARHFPEGGAAAGAVPRSEVRVSGPGGASCPLLPLWGPRELAAGPARGSNWGVSFY